MSELPKIAQQQLEKVGAKSMGANAHPDADLLTAFTERNLAVVERENVMQHLAMCAECREMVAISLSPVNEAAAITAKPEPGLLHWKFLRFGLGTALAALIIAALVFSRLENKDQPATVATFTQPAAPAASNSRNSAESKVVATVDDSQPPRQAANAHVAQDGSPKSEKTTISRADDRNHAFGLAKDKLRDSKAPRNASVAGLYRPRNPASGAMADAGSPSSPAIARANGNYDRLTETRREANSTFASAKTQPAGGVIAGQPPSSRNTEASRNGAAQKANRGGVSAMSVSPDADKQAQSQSQTLAQAAAPSVATGLSQQQTSPVDAISTMKSDRASALTAKKTMRAAPSEQTITSQAVAESNATSTAMLRVPASPITWRISNGKLQKSRLDDQFQSRWKDVPTGTQAKLRTLVINDSSIWAGGDGGVLCHSENNGTDWTQIAGSWTGDIVSLRFNSLRRGQMETSTHETWLTGDGGATWHKQP